MTMERSLFAPLALSLERIGESDAALTRVLFSDSLAQALARWVPGLTIGPANPQAPDGAVPAFAVTLAGAQAELKLRLPQCIDAVSASVLAAGSWSPAVRLACLNARAKAALGGLLTWLCGLELQPARLESSAAAFVAQAGDMAFECSVGGHRIDAALRCGDSAWLARLQGSVRRLCRGDLSSLAHLPVPVFAVLGSRQLPLGLLRSLETGDVLMLHRQSGAVETFEHARLMVGRRRRGAIGRPCAISGREITLTGDKWMNTELLDPHAAREDEVDASARPELLHFPGPDPMADIEVDIQIVLQVLSTPLGELAAMRPGYVLELPVAATEACVDLVVGGQVHGRAQLVCVGDRLGARILELFHDAA
jgi:type III secretion protein Q